MDVGKGCIIADQWIPQGVSTGLEDINGSELKTADLVQLNGCSSRYAVVGRGMAGRFMLYFGGEHGSVGWFLNQEAVSKHKVRLATAN